MQVIKSATRVGPVLAVNAIRALAMSRHAVNANRPVVTEVTGAFVPMARNMRVFPHKFLVAKFAV